MFPMRQAVADRTFLQITKRILGLCELKAQWRLSQYPAEAAEQAEQAEPAFADFRTPRKCRSPRRDMAVIIDFSRLVGWSERILVQIILHGGQQLRLFNAHYDEYGFQPIVVFDGDGRFVGAVLRPAKRPSGAEIRPVDFILGLAPTTTLRKQVADLEASTLARFEASAKTNKVRRFKEFFQLEPRGAHHRPRRGRCPR